MNSVRHIASVDARPASPIRCPVCDGMGKLIGVEARPGSTTLKLVCPYCEQQWNYVKPDQPLSKLRRSFLSG